MVDDDVPPGPCEGPEPIDGDWDWPFAAGPPHPLPGQQLHHLRVERGFTRELVAMCVGIAVEHVEEHERGTRRIRGDELAAYAAFFGVRLAHFFRDPSRGETR